jgi:hypothetical protein
MDTKELNDRQHRKGRQIKQARLEIVAELYKRGKSIRNIAKEVRVRLALDKTPSSQTIFADIQILLQEWREYRISNTDELVQLELERIDDAIVELWDAWNKSKEDYEQKIRKQKGEPTEKGKEKNPASKEMEIYYLEQQRKEIRKFGDVSYISEIRQQLQERRKLLGLYAPERREHTGKDGLPLNPPASGAVNVDDLSDEELTVLYNIASKRDKAKQ